MLTEIFYIWGVINLSLLITPIFYDRNYLNSRIYDKKLFIKKSQKILSANYLTFFWCLIGLFSNQWLWFLFYFIFIFLSRKLINVDLLNYPTRLNIELSRMMKISIFLIIMFPIINYYYLDINILNYFSYILKQCMTLFRI